MTQTFAITIINPEGEELGVMNVEGDYWTRDDNENVFVYNEDDDQPVAEIDRYNFAAIAREPNTNNGTFEPST